MKEMPSSLTGKIYDIQGFSLHDGPGIRTTVFLKGCPLRCPWCHSPESQQFHAQLSWIAMKCIGIELCGKCINACPTKAISPGKTTLNVMTNEAIRLIRIDRSRCDNCGDCATACYPKALHISGTDYTVEEVVERVAKDTPFYEQSGGGVTISGGEPLSQPEFVVLLAEQIKKRGLHTAFDTSGYGNFEILERLIPFVGLFLYDLKHMDSGRHKAATGVPNELILENARKLAGTGAKMQIRIPVIPRFNDSEENVRATASFCKSLGKAVTVIQLLPYHNLGVVKYQRISDRIAALEAAPPSEDTIHSIKLCFEEYGLAVTVH
ncbi:MAG TPA: glycyl-radical enzyme activating protein [Acidobacteriota bacterium]|nr:glycyl-radical enzyme activating protein [Acidobacteriota bacterium]